MGIKDFGKLAKLVIQPDKGKPFTVMFNPESYSQTYSTVYREVKTVDTGIETYVYAKTLPQDFKLKIIIDGTGVADYNSDFFVGALGGTKKVHEQVKEFLEMAWYPDDGQAVPLEIIWGEFRFKCVLKEVTINYTLFGREGDPLRAELDACFISDPEKLKQEYEKQNKKNPPNTATAAAKGPDKSEKSAVNGIVISAS